MKTNLIKDAVCGLCLHRFPDTELVVMFTVPDDDAAYAPPAIHHVECLNCHHTYHTQVSLLDNSLEYGPELCGTLREFRDGTLPLGWWMWEYYYSMSETEVEDGMDSEPTITDLPEGEDKHG